MMFRHDYRRRIRRRSIRRSRAMSIHARQRDNNKTPEDFMLLARFAPASLRWRSLAAVFAASLALFALAAPVDAQSAWPTRQIRIVVPFAPGGASDILARLIAKELGERVKQPVIVENKPGAGGTIGADLVAKSPPDGYTLLLADSSVLMTFPTLYPNLPYAYKDLIPVANIATFGLILIAPANAKFNTLAEVIASDKANPGKLNMASPGSGSSNHLTLEKFNAAAGTKIVHVPYKGTGPAINDLIGGQVELAFASGAASKPLLDGGKVKALAVTSAKRNPLLPQVPTIAEAGVVGFEAIAGQGLFVPAGTPRDIVVKLNTEVNAIIAAPEMRERWTAMGIDRVENTPEQFSAWLARESDEWAALIRKQGIKPE
jgi:tripartite-type tricarboxylate transporter receptor subunit TctC